MIDRRSLVVALAVAAAACRSSSDPPPEPTVVEPDPLPPVPEPPVEASDARPDDDQPVADSDARPGTCVPQGAILPIRTTAAELHLCIDTDADGEPDQCAAWNRRTGALTAVDTVFHVEDPAGGTAAPEIEMPGVNARVDDDRFVLHDERIDLCPKDRACMTFLPEVEDGGDVEDAWLLGSGVVALAIVGAELHTGTLEVWDSNRGRRLRRTALELDPDDNYKLSIQLAGDAIVVIEEASAHDGTRGEVFGPDGSRRAALAGGATAIDPEQIRDLGGGRIAAIDLGAPDAPYTVIVQNLRTGAIFARFAIAVDAVDTDGPDLRVVDRSTIAVIQHGLALSVELIEVTTRTTRRLTAPGC